MANIVVTLMHRETNATMTVVKRNYRGHSVALLHAEILKNHPGYFIRKSIVKR